MNKRKGFTLVELLVVIAIIALLMGILLPALARVRRAAKGSACMVQIKQWGTVYAMYTGDFDGYFIPDYYEDAEQNPFENSIKCNWWLVLESYYKDRDLLCCPAATKIRDISSSGVIGDNHEGGKVPFCASSLGGDFKASYFYSGWLGVCTNEAMANTYKRYSPWRWATVNRIVQPNFVPVVGDMIGWGRKFPQADTDPMGLDEPDKTPAECDVSDVVHDRILECVIRRHGAMNNPNINMAFGDFSVRPVGLKALWSLKWHRTWVAERKGSSTNVTMTNSAIWPEWMKDYSEDGVINYIP